MAGTSAAVLPPKMSVTEKSLFGLGAAAFGIKDGGFNSYLLLFYNQIVGVPAAEVGFAIFAAILVDAISDPFIGALSDRWRSRFGRRHPFMFAAAVPVAVLYFMVWNPPAWSASALFLYLLATLISVRIAIACYEVPNVALVAEMSRDYDERTSLLSYRLFFQVLIPTAVGLIVLSTFMKAAPGYRIGMLNPAAYTPYSIFASLVMLFCILVAVFGTRSRIPYLETNLNRPTVGIFTAIKESFRSLSNPSFVLVTISGVFSGMAGGVGVALATYFNVYFWKFTSEQLRWLVLAVTFAGIIASVVSPYLSRRFGKKQSGIALAVVWLFTANLAQILKLVGLLPPDGSNALLIVVFCTTLVAWTLLIAVLILLISMITDVNEDNELRTGQRSEGLFAAASSFVNKVVSGVGIWVGSLLIAFVHFPKGAKPETIDPAIVRELVIINIPVQVVLIGIAIWLLSLYKIDRTVHEANLEKLVDASLLAAESDAVESTRLG